MTVNAKRTAAGLRELLFEMIDGVKAGTIDDKKARTIANLSASILKSVEVELQFRAQIMRGGLTAADMGELPLAALPAPQPECKPTESEMGDKRPKITNPVVPPGQPVFVRGRAQSGSH